MHCDKQGFSAFLIHPIVRHLLRLPADKDKSFHFFIEIVIVFSKSSCTVFPSSRKQVRKPSARISPYIPMCEVANVPLMYISAALETASNVSISFCLLSRVVIPAIGGTKRTLSGDNRMCSFRNGQFPVGSMCPIAPLGCAPLGEGIVSPCSQMRIGVQKLGTDIMCQS